MPRLPGVPAAALRAPAVQYQPFTITVNGAGFDPAIVQVELVGSSTSSCPTRCTFTNFSTKTTTQLVVSSASLSIPGTYTVYARNGNYGFPAVGPIITVRSMY